jgi:hypothetical protein
MVQESRFRIARDDGRAFLFTLARDANVEPQQLTSLARSGAVVRVDYSGEPNRVSGSARCVQAIRLSQ